MPDYKAQSYSIEYLPSGNTYRYLPQLENNLAYEFVAKKKGEKAKEVGILESHGYDSWYAHRYCDTLIFGGYVMKIDDELHFRGSNFWGYEVYESNSFNLNEPLATAYSNQTVFVGGEEFGQDELSSVPSYIDTEFSGSDTLIKWYYNGSLLVTQTIAGHHVDSFIIAGRESNQILSNYAFVWYENGSYWASGDMTNNDVMEKILRNKGNNISSQTQYGWADPNDPDNPDRVFLLSRLFSKPGYSNWVAGGRVGETLSSATDDLYDTENTRGAMIGTDLITYITEIPESSLAWDYLMNDPESDGLSMAIPSSDPETTYEIKWNYSTKHFEFYTNGTYVSDTSAYQYRTSPGVFLIGTLDGGSSLGWCYTIRTSGAIVVPQYNFYTSFGVGLVDIDYDEFDFNEAYLDYYNGFDDADQEEDNPQDDPEDMEDPSVDALSTGFLYAFQVETTDMENLVSCLNGQTLAQKIKGDFGNHLFDFIVSYHVMPCITNATELSRVGINYMGVPFVYGENDTQLTLKRITSSFYKVDLNSIHCLPKVKRGNGFENWANAQVQLYLPFIGTVHLNTADVWGKDVHVVYYFDILAGTCTVNVGTPNNGTLYSFTGSCVYKIPFTSTIDQSMQNMIAGVTSAGSGLISMVSGGMSGNMMSVINGAMGVAGSVGSFVSAMEHKAQINRGGSVGGSGGWHSPRQPALIITVPDVADINKTQYPNMNGYPCHEAVVLNNYKGKYVEVGQIDLKAQSNSDGAFPNDSELDMIRSALKEGVYV